MKNKSLASLDINLLYTNMPVNKCIKRLGIHLKKTNIMNRLSKIEPPIDFTYKLETNNPLPNPVA